MNKTKWYTRPVYLLVALAVVVSLGVGGIVQPNAPQASANPGSGSLMVDIVKVINATGDETTNFTKGECFLVNAAVAYKDIGGNSTLASVNATIVPGQYAALATSEGGAYTKNLGSIPSNNVTDVWWRVCCTDEGISTITVTANSTTGLSASASVNVTQGTPLPPVLKVELIECPNQTVLNQSDNFVIKARVNNTHTSINATNVSVTISGYALVNASLNDPDRVELGTIWHGESTEVAWNLHCDGYGRGNVTIDAEAFNLEPTQITPAYCYVNQGAAPPTPGPLTVTVDAPAKWCDDECCIGLNLFNISATVCNPADTGENATNVNVTLTITGPANFLAGAGDATHSLGNITDGNCKNTTWNISCTGRGTVIFNVTTAANANQTWANGKWGTANTSQQDFTVRIMEVINPNAGQNLTYPNVTGHSTWLESCQNFTVNVTLQNCIDDTVRNVTATIVLPDSVELSDKDVCLAHYTQNGTLIPPVRYISPPDVNVTELTFCGCCYYNISWELHCKASSNGTAENITVTASHEGSELDNDYFMVTQIEKAHLAAGIEVYPGNYTDDTLVTTAVEGVYVCQNFTIVIPVINLGEASAMNVSVNYTISGNTSCVLNKTLGHTNYTSDTIPTLAGGEAGKFLIPCHCAGEEDLNITVNFINGTDEFTGEEIVPDNKYLPAIKPVMQIPFDVKIIQPTAEGRHTFNCSEEFAVKINITNDSDDPTNNVTGVNATIYWESDGDEYAGANFVNANTPHTRSVGNISVDSNPQEAAWLMHCNAMGTVNFTVTVTATKPLMNIVETVSVTQEGTTSLTVEILSPEHTAMTPTYATCEEFAVTANVSNSGSRESETVIATIDPGTYARVVSGSNTTSIGTLDPGEWQIVSWTLHAYKAGAACNMTSNSITVTATAPCADTGSDNVTVDVYPAAHLVVAASAPTEVEVGSDFNVTVTVTNTGWADASQVKLSIDTGDNSALTPGESLTKTIGTLVGFTVHEYVNVNWTLQCEGAGKSTIIITPVGNDECGWHAKQNATTLETVWRHQPGRAINPDFLEPDDVTVEQKTIIPGDVVTTIDIVTGLNFISTPKKLQNSTFTDFVSDISWSIAYEFDPTAPNPFIQITDPINTTVNVLDGYWIQATAPGTINLTYRAGLMLPPSKDLTGKAWNAIGFSSTSENGLSAMATLMSVEGSWSTLIGWNAAGQSYEGAIIKGVNDDERMYPGKGYWLWVTADDTLAGVGA